VTPRGSVLAIDHGTKRTGFAVADPLRVVVQPLSTWHGPGDSDELLDYVGALMAERTVEALLVGVPLSPQGEARGARAADVERFIERLRARFEDVAVIACDERLSTKEAEHLLREAGLHGAERRERRDSWSALVILRSWIEDGEPR
jgi:putative Holliday junction resolvase